MHAEWLIEGRVCQVIVPPEVSEEMLYAYDKQVIELMETAPGIVHVLVDVSPMNIIPSVKHWISIKMARHPQFGQTLLIGLEHKPVMRFFVSVVSQSLRVPVKSFSTQDAALDYLRKTNEI
jgi:hypothetical protein